MQMPQTSIKNTGSFVVVIKRVKIQFEKKINKFHSKNIHNQLQNTADMYYNG